MTDARPFSAVPDPDDGDAIRPATTSGGSPLDILRAEARNRAQFDPITLEVPGREGWAVRFRADVNMDRLEMWQKAAKDKGRPDGVDLAKLACIVLANQCESLVYEGKDVTASDEVTPLTFNHQEFLDATGSQRAVGAVAHWYSSDGVLIVIMTDVLRASGFDEDAVSRVDPTRMS